MRKQYGKLVNKKDQQRQKRRLSIRNKISGTTERPRIVAMRSNKHITVQVIDDTKSTSLFTVSTFGKSAAADSCNIEGAKKVGLNTLLMTEKPAKLASFLKANGII